MHADGSSQLACSQSTRSHTSYLYSVPLSTAWFLIYHDDLFIWLYVRYRNKRSRFSFWYDLSHVCAEQCEYIIFYLRHGMWSWVVGGHGHSRFRYLCLELNLGSWLKIMCRISRVFCSYPLFQSIEPMKLTLPPLCTSKFVVLLWNM
jgi:hypothetical protein